jgi:hypothetical protein
MTFEPTDDGIYCYQFSTNLVKIKLKNIYIVNHQETPVPAAANHQEARVIQLSYLITETLKKIQ